ncbi:hypothetical protein NC651_006895 [Populus alba x Populus x berolinensis]|nr:hypothetical protein NC651_006895 [Populus alba x Populus x berolinensis]
MGLTRNNQILTRLSLTFPSQMSPNQIMILAQSQNQARGMIQNHTLTNRSFPNHKLLSQIMVMIQKQMFPHQNPATGMTQNQSLRGIEGLVLCKQGFNYTPIKGAVIRIACTIMDQYGYRKTPFPCLSEAANAKGY